MKNITFINNIFHIKTNNTSYIFKVNKFNHLEHIYYGSKVEDDDYEALTYKRNIPYGDQIRYSQDDLIYSLDNTPQEFPSYGRGDFNSPIIEILKNQSYTTDFLYKGYEVIEGDIKIKNLPSSYGADETLIIHLVDDISNLDIDLYYAIYPNENIISRRCILTNHGSNCILNKLLSYSFEIIEHDLQLYDLRGGWNKETHINKKDIKVGKYIIDSTLGFSGSKCNPAFLIKQKDTDEDNGSAWGFNLVYSGNHYSLIEQNEYGLTRIQGGISPDRFALVLKDNESFETPEAILTYSNYGLNGLSYNFHNFINNHIIRSDWKFNERPILINSWEGFGFKFNKSDLIKLARNGKDLGMELFVLDDGWFGRRSDDTKGLGDYDCNENKIPGGIKSLSNEIHNMGMLFGIWVEPEAISIDSALYEKHPEYALREKNRHDVLGRNELMMDLCNPEVRDYIVEKVSKLIDENNIDYIKWDMNRNITGVSGIYNHEYIKGLYEVLDRIFTPRPHVLFESCSSGGNRFDLGMLCYSPQIWASDDTDPIERLDIQKGLSYFYPQSTIGAHVSSSPHSQTLRATPLETRFAVAALGNLGYELDLNMLSNLEKEEIKKQITYYKKHRKTFQYGHLYRFNDNEEEYNFEIKTTEAILIKVRKLSKAAPSFSILKVKGLDPKKKYIISSKSHSHNVRQFGNLINHLLPIRLNAEGMIVNEFAKYRGIESTREEYHASGAALASGIKLNSLYLGTGYNDELRLPLDFGSELYRIKEDNHEQEEE